MKHIDSKLSGLQKVASAGFGAIKTGLVALGAGAIAGATAVGALGVSAIKAYAQYEQLVGGVETLFKGSAGKVEEYADNAYKTAGLSANQYMETVTSFSASLLQSLGGDTEKAAEYADMAITDMSDNANKMGTSMESIQFAYQGFAKQNFTMLDNLKLGYGGTKEEMQRLLEDATLLSGIEYDISSYADIVEAIHVVQDEMGITGTTAKEASETISGSIASMKGAWTNLITGMADKNADFKKLMSNFIESVKIVGKNLFPVIEQTLMGVGELIEGLLPSIMEALPRIINNVLPKILKSGINIVNSLIIGIKQNLPTIAKGAVDIVQQLITSLIAMLPELLDMGIKLIVELALGIAEMLPTLIPLAIDAIFKLIDTLLANIDLIIDAGIALVIGLTDGIINAVPILIEKAPIIMFKLFEALINNAPKIIGAGLEIILKLGQGILDNLFKIPEYIGKLWEKIKSSTSSAFKGIVDVGKNLVKGLWEGIKSMGSWIGNKVGGIFGGIADKIKNIFGINSPSRLFKYFGQMIDKGFIIGIEGGAKEIEKTFDNTFSFEEPKGFADFSKMRGNFRMLSESKLIEIPQGNSTQMVSQTKEQIVNFYQPVQTPDEMSRALRMQQRYGLAGG